MNLLKVLTFGMLGREKVEQKALLSELQSAEEAADLGFTRIDIDSGITDFLGSSFGDYHDLEAPVKFAYRAVPWVYRCAQIRAESIIKSPIFVANKDGVKIEGHRLNNIFDSKSASKDSFVTFMLRTIITMDMCGTAYIRRITDKSGKTISLQRLNPSKINPVIASKSIGHVKYGTEEIPANEIIRLYWPDPLDENIGCAPYVPAMRAVKTENLAIDYNSLVIKNGGFVSMILAFKRRMTKKQIDEANKNIEARVSGAANAKRILLLGDDVTAVNTSPSNVDLDFIKGRKWSMVEICTAYGVPPAIIHQDNANYNNMETAMVQLWQTIESLIIIIESQLNHAFRLELEPGQRIIFDNSNQPAVLAAYAAKIKIAKQMHEMGVSIEEINKRLRLGL